MTYTSEQKAQPGRKLTDEELDTVVGGNFSTAMYGTSGADQLQGTSGNDYMNGGHGDDILSGEQGNDLLYGGAGNDAAYGGSGNDTYIWDHISNDTFVGGDGNDQVQLDNFLFQSVQSAVESQWFNIQLTDANNNPVTITADMWDSNGNLNIGSEMSGTVTDVLTGNQLSFSGVESIVMPSYL